MFVEIVRLITVINLKPRKNTYWTQFFAATNSTVDLKKCGYKKNNGIERCHVKPSSSSSYFTYSQFCTLINDSLGLF